VGLEGLPLCSFSKSAVRFPVRPTCNYRFHTFIATPLTVTGQFGHETDMKQRRTIPGLLMVTLLSLRYEGMGCINLPLDCPVVCFCAHG
jgi:hypothetical protein